MMGMKRIYICLLVGSLVSQLSFGQETAQRSSAAAGMLPIMQLSDGAPAQQAVSIGKAFLGKPYVAHTLEGGELEQLVVNLQEFDCTTYLETVLALTLTRQEVGNGGTDARYEEVFRRYLTHLRYRNGRIEGYASRLHYFSEWLFDNERKGLVQDITREIGGLQVSKPVYYMTASAAKYPKLSDPATHQQISQVQERISRQSFWFVPSKQVRTLESRLQEGDIVMLTAARPGLDMKHVGLATWQNGRVHLLHASSDHGRVMVTDEPLADYLARRPRLSGIRVARLKVPQQPMMVRAR